MSLVRIIRQELFSRMELPGGLGVSKYPLSKQEVRGSSLGIWQIMRLDTIMLTLKPVLNV